MKKSFANPKKQAERAVAKVLALGKSRHDSRNDGNIHSLGTGRNYQQSLKLACEWDKINGGIGLPYFDPNRAIQYLQHRAQVVGQKTLDLDRQALQILPGITTKLDRVFSKISRKGLADQGRAYTAEQVTVIANAQSAHNAIATEIAYFAGLRGHELFTLLPAKERGPSLHRQFAVDRFLGRENFVRYTVCGKGGLIREVALPQELVLRLEASRFIEPRIVLDRGIRYEQHYAIGGGQAWSSSFGRASERVLGWSTGAHGLRHGYAQERMNELQGQGYLYKDAQELVSQEMGHFRADITEVYLR